MFLVFSAGTDDKPGRFTSDSRFYLSRPLDSAPVVPLTEICLPQPQWGAVRARIEKRMLFLFVAAASFCVAFLSCLETAHAAPIGMCSDTAQSIAAPPPMFPTKDILLKSCDEDADEGLRVESPGAPNERVSPSAEIPDQKVVLDSTARTFRVSSYLYPLEKASLELPEEHRWLGLRPPTY